MPSFNLQFNTLKPLALDKYFCRPRRSPSRARPVSLASRRVSDGASLPARSRDQADAAAARETARDDPARSGARSETTNSQQVPQVLEDPDPELRELAQSSSVGPPPGPKSSASSVSSSLRERRERLNRFVKGQTFEGVVTMMIFASAIHVGLQTDYMCRYPNDALPLRYRAVDIIFMFFFTLEVLVRLFARGLEFFWTRGWAWNCFDLFLVMLQMTEEALTLTGFGRQSPSAYGLRIVRSLRSVRSMRILQVMEFTEELRLLVSCILHSLQAFFWSILLILMLIYIASIYYAAAVLDYRNDNRGAPLGSEELRGWRSPQIVPTFRKIFVVRS